MAAQRIDRIELGHHIAAQTVSFASTHGDQTVERQIQRAHKQIAHRILILFGSFHRQHVRHVYVLRQRQIVFHAERVAQFASRLLIGSGQLRIHVNPMCVLAMIYIIDKHIHMAACQPCRNTRAHRVIQKSNRPRQAKGHIQKTMVDAFDLHSHFPSVLADQPAAIAGHTLHEESLLLFTQVCS